MLRHHTNTVMARTDPDDGVPDSVYCATREEWREWLAENHDKVKSVWLIYYKKNSGKPRVSYDEAVEEAICFGWIDSTARKMDDERYAQKFTPRNARSEWSETNLRRAERLIAEGRMTEAGMARYRNPRKVRELHQVDERGEVVIPEDLFKAIQENPAASAYFGGLAQSHRKHYVRWINDARRPETRARRIVEAVSLLARNLKYGEK